MTWIVVNWLTLSGLYLAFTGQISAEELAVALSGGLAATAYRVVGSRCGRPFSSGFAAAMQLSPRILATVCRDMAKFTMVFIKAIMVGHRPRGSFIDIAFDPGQGDAPSRMRRGLVIAGISLSPNTYVLAVRHPQNLLTLHALIPIPPPRNVQWPL
jgi:hypothetical protein